MALDPSEVTKLLPEVRTLINKVVKKNMADGFLFSAGTDTQIIAYEAVKYKPDIPCLTLAFKHGNPKDTEYVKKMVELLHLKQETYQFGKEDVLKYLSESRGSTQKIRSHGNQKQPTCLHRLNHL